MGQYSWQLYGISPLEILFDKGAEIHIIRALSIPENVGITRYHAFLKAYRDNKNVMK